MFAAQQPEQPGFPTATPQDPEALLAYAEATAAYARLLKRIAPQPQQHAQQRQLPGHELYTDTQAGPKKPADDDAGQGAKSAQAAVAGSSLWTIIVWLLIGAVGGVACDRNMRAAADDRHQPQQQQARAN
jgi:hypothetical protein